ncbi:hypothetical protein [Lactococcus lactis]|uniref:Uncharacterized protein n=1 Tax=Lactococcus lactis TaxID=1358 RepID=A0A3S3LMY2_9LACT|nr:hypothetical protein [Lactococcus lactis]MBD5855679.1 hypothetical protein [Lactococcus lactis]NYZ59580.1 hypothetical protein [Lactococcus lactis]RWR45329.1 hypothetical protein EO246_10335 [Lactococcus lactis]
MDKYLRRSYQRMNQMSFGGQALAWFISIKLSDFVLKKFENIGALSELQISCFNTIASHFGPQLLVEGFGVSLTQASRYGKLEDYLIDEQIQTQREYVSNYSDG